MHHIIGTEHCKDKLQRQQLSLMLFTAKVSRILGHVIMYVLFHTLAFPDQMDRAWWPNRSNQTNGL